MTDAIEYIKNRFRPVKYTYDDETPYPFGKFQRVPMKDVPVAYLKSVYKNNRDNYKHPTPERISMPMFRVCEYVHKNIINK